jgi:choline-glycine betaine transporter
MVIEYNYGAFNLYSISILLIVVGGLLIITVFLGIIGALKDVSNVRVVTLVLLFILFAILGKRNFE